MIWSFQWCYDCGWSNPFPSGKIISKPCVSCMWPCIPPTCVPVVFPICSRCSLKPTHVLMIFPIMFHMYVPMYVSQMVFILYIDNMYIYIYMSYKSYMWYVSHLFPISFAQPAAVDQSHHLQVRKVEQLDAQHVFCAGQVQRSLRRWATLVAMATLW